MLVPHLLKIYFGLGLPSSVLEIVSSQRLKTNGLNFQMISTPQEHEFISKPDSKALN